MPSELDLWARSLLNTFFTAAVIIGIGHAAGLGLGGIAAMKAILCHRDRQSTCENLRKGGWRRNAASGVNRSKSGTRSNARLLPVRTARSALSGRRVDRLIRSSLNTGGRFLPQAPRPRARCWRRVNAPLCSLMGRLHFSRVVTARAPLHCLWVRQQRSRRRCWIFSSRHRSRPEPS